MDKCPTSTQMSTEGRLCSFVGAGLADGWRCPPSPTADGHQLLSPDHRHIVTLPECAKSSVTTDVLAVLLSVLMTCGRENGKKSIAAQSNNAMFPRLFHHKLLGNIGGRGVHLSTVPSLTSGAKHSEVTAVWGEDADPLNSGMGVYLRRLQSKLLSAGLTPFSSSGRSF